MTMPPKLASVPAFPSVALKLLSLLADGKSSFSSIAECIATDPALSGKLIKRANAADQLRYCEARNIQQAVGALGIDRTREISLATATSSFAGSAIKTEILRPCWHHTVACALAASEVARQWGLPPAEPYTAGLLHDIGRLGLLAAYPAEYENLMAGADGQPEDLIGAERECFGVDHVEAGLWLARQWNLPESIVEAIGRHHETPSGKLDEVTVVQIACRLADLLGFSVNRPGKPPELEEITSALPAWMGQRLSAQLPALKAAIDEEIWLFHSSDVPPEESPEESVEDREPEPGPVACDFHDEVSPAAISLPHLRPAIIAAIFAAAVLVLSGVLFFPR
ncbi:hypothetical protein SBA3_3700004 [Candidatus Sulfopaludibacter sp. SbA3]|nr:hypothetical protein SBA3_3700004 [Candidatus Sulfopaludibacter sp. SbA3]